MIVCQCQVGKPGGKKREGPRGRAACARRRCLSEGSTASCAAIDSLMSGAAKSDWWSRGLDMLLYCSLALTLRLNPTPHAPRPRRFSPLPSSPSSGFAAEAEI